MTNRIMLRACASENAVSIQTFSARMKSPQWFYISYEELDRLQRDGSIIIKDILSFAQLRLDELRDQIEFRFTWLTGCGCDHVEGVEQTVTLCWSKFLVFIQNCHLTDSPKTYRTISLDTKKSRPKIVFGGNRENLRAAIANPHIRHKLSKALMDNFNWPDTDEIRIYNDSVPYSFFFQAIRGGQIDICGGLILHNQNDPSHMAYSIHT